MALNNVLYVDDYASPEAAVSAANTLVSGGAQGATVVFGAKAYTTNGVDAGSFVSLVGQGRGKTRLTLANGQNRPVIRGVNFTSLTGTAKQTPELRGDNYIRIEGMTIDGNKANNTSGYAIQLWGKNYRFVDLVMTNCKSGGFYTEYTDQYDVANHPEREMLESVYDDLHICGCDGNGYDNHGPHDSMLNNAVIWSNSGWAVNIETVGDSIGGLLMFNVNSYLNGTGSFRVRGDLQSAIGCVASAGYIGTGWDIDSSRGDIKMIGCNTSGHKIGLLLAGTNHMYSGIIQQSIDGSGATMGAGVVLNGAFGCRIDAVGADNDYFLRINSGGDLGYNRIAGSISVPSGKAFVSSPLNADLTDPASAGSFSNTTKLDVPNSKTGWMQQAPQGMFAVQGGIRVGTLSGLEAATPEIHSGYGAPNGVQTAPAASIYLDYQNEELWFKSSGSGNTGWNVVGAPVISQVNGTGTSVAHGTSGTNTVACPTGTAVVGGGCNWSTGANQNTVITTNAPTNVGWMCQGTNNQGSGNVTLTAHAICLG